MRKVLLLVVFALLFSVNIPASAQFNRFEGNWVNVDQNTGGISRLEISGTANNVRVHAWGACTPTDCDWGEVDGYAYGPNVSANLTDSAEAISAVFGASFKETIVILRFSDRSHLQAEVFDRFTDQSGRSSYFSLDTFESENVVISQGNIDEFEAFKFCFNFESLPLGEVYGIGDGFAITGAQVKLQEFQWSDRSWTNGGQATVENDGKAGGWGYEIGLNNINLLFEFEETLKGLVLPSDTAK